MAVFSACRARVLRKFKRAPVLVRRSEMTETHRTTLYGYRLPSSPILFKLPLCDRQQPSLEQTMMPVPSIRSTLFVREPIVPHHNNFQLLGHVCLQRKLSSSFDSFLPASEIEFAVSPKKSLNGEETNQSKRREKLTHHLLSHISISNK